MLLFLNNKFLKKKLSPLKQILKTMHELDKIREFTIPYLIRKKTRWLAWSIYTSLFIFAMILLFYSFFRLNNCSSLQQATFPLLYFSLSIIIGRFSMWVRKKEVHKVLDKLNLGAARTPNMIGFEKEKLDNVFEENIFDAITRKYGSINNDMLILLIGQLESENKNTRTDYLIFGGAFAFMVQPLYSKIIDHIYSPLLGASKEISLMPTIVKIMLFIIPPIIFIVIACLVVLIQDLYFIRSANYQINESLIRYLKSIQLKLAAKIQ